MQIGSAEENEKANLSGSLGAKYSDLLDMHEANCNMVVVRKTHF